MKKKRILLLAGVIGFVVIIGFIGTILISVSSITYSIGDVTVVPTIEATQMIPYPVYDGYLIVSTPISIANKGFYSIRDLTINISIIAVNWMISSHLNGEQIGQGVNDLGSITGQQTLNDVITINVTDYIPHLAIEDCTLRIFVSISLIYQPLISVPFYYNPTPIEILYDAPFNL